MTEKATISDDWLADRAALHDAKTISATLDGKTLSIQIDDEWPNVTRAVDGAVTFGGWLSFEGTEISEGSVEDVAGRFVSELKLNGKEWVLYLAKPSLFSRRGRLAFVAEVANFIPQS